MTEYWEITAEEIYEPLFYSEEMKRQLADEYKQLIKEEQTA